MNNLKKRGMSELVSYVLLIGLSVMLATIVTMWYRSQSESFQESIYERTEADIRCNDVSINVKLNCAQPKFNVTNRGYHAISKVIQRQVEFSRETQISITPGETSSPQDLYIPDRYNDFDIIPVIAVDGKDAVSYTHLTLPTTPYV